MCGLTGFWNFKASMSHEDLCQTVESMAVAISHRGPDSAGVWVDSNVGIALGHRRLAIIDLSEAGHQPMISRSGRSVIVYNGEIYNTADLRTELAAKGCEFRGHSDTEVILEACELWGVKATCQRLIGMFSFALWDRASKKLLLTRDRLGIKPLYWGFNQGTLFFGSQLKSFISHPHFKSELDTGALTSYFRFNYVPTPYSIFKEIQKLPAATLLTIDANGQVSDTLFWDFKTVVQQGLSARSVQSESELVEELDVLLRDAVKRRMIADVPLGAFLSGGIDSSTVVALMQAQSSSPIKSFSIGFSEEAYNEAKYAAKVAEYLGTEHHECYLSALEAQAIIPELSNWFDEPFADVSQIPTFLVSKIARQHVTVSLSGDGGDELFAGYNRYLLGHRIWQKLTLLPMWLKKMGSGGIRKIDAKYWDKLNTFLPRGLCPPLMGDKAYKLADLLMMPDRQAFYCSLVNIWDQPANLVLGAEETPPYPWREPQGIHFENAIEEMQFLDTLTYLADDILTKVDRASMAVSLEGRVPLLDHRVVEFAWRLPLEMKVKNGIGKRILRQVLNRYVPSPLIDRPKMGFGVPIDQWLRGPLREWAEDLLSENHLRQQGILDPVIIRQRWLAHLSGQRNWQYSIWGRIDVSSLAGKLEKITLVREFV